MSITPNILNDDCTSLAGWTILVNCYDISGGGIHFDGGVAIGYMYKDNPSAGLQVTAEFKTSFVSLSTMHEEASTSFSLLCGTKGAGLLFYSDGVCYGAPGGSQIKIADIVMTETIWRIELDASTGYATFYMDGVSLGNYEVESVADIGNVARVMSIVSDYQHGAYYTEGYILPNIKVGDGLGDFGSTESTEYVPRNIVKHRK